MKTFAHTGINEGRSTHRKQFMNHKESTRDNWLNKRRFN